MNRITFIFSVVLSMLLWACAGTESQSQESTEASANVEETTTPEASSKSYTINVLNDSIPSPKKELTTSIGGVDVRIVYGSPSVKGRTVWGDLVPYGSVWRTGANEATTLEVSSEVSIGGQTLPAGKYGFFTIPGESDWTLIFNEVADQWGAYEYDESKDVMRVKVVPQAVEDMSETMEFSVADGNLILHWEKMQVPFEIVGA